MIIKERKRWYFFIRAVCHRIIFAALGGLRTLHADRVPLEGPVIFAPVHFSFLDPPLVACGSPRQITFMAKKELFDAPIFGSLIRSLGAFPISRGAGDKEAIKMAMSLLEQNRAMLMFPEGTRGFGENLHPMTSGILMLVRKTGAKVVPVGINGTQIVLPKGKSKPKRHRILIAFGEPIDYKELVEKLGAAGAKAQFNLILESSLIALCEEIGLPLKASPKEEAPENASEEFKTLG